VEAQAVGKLGWLERVVYVQVLRWGRARYPPCAGLVEAEWKPQVQYPLPQVSKLER
jgi:hypothetical protein